MLTVDFILEPKGLEATINHHLLGPPPPSRKGGMGVWQIYRAYASTWPVSSMPCMYTQNCFPTPLKPLCLEP